MSTCLTFWSVRSAEPLRGAAARIRGQIFTGLETVELVEENRTVPASDLLKNREEMVETAKQVAKATLEEGRTRIRREAVLFRGRHHRIDAGAGIRAARE